MVGWISAIGAVFGAVKSWFQWRIQGRLIRAGVDKAKRESLENTLQALAKVRRVMRDARSNKLRGPDKYRRD